MRIGCEVGKVRLWFKASRVTRYTLTNVRGERSSARVLMDHTASMAHGGFKVITEERCVKASAGVSRFEFGPLAAGEKISFDVLEEAVYSQDLASDDEIKTWFQQDATRLVADVLTQHDRKAIEQYVGAATRRSMLRAIQQQAVSESMLESWGIRPLEAGSTQDSTQAEPANATGVPCALEDSRSQDPVTGDLPEEICKMLSQQLLCIQAIRNKQHLLEGKEACILKIEGIQQRLRENIKGLDKCQGQSEKLVSRYLADLHDQEDQLASANASIDELNEAMFSLKEQLARVKKEASKQAQLLLETV